MEKCGLFAFGANESSACMCLYQKMFHVRRDQFPAKRCLRSREEKEGTLIAVIPEAFLKKILTNLQRFESMT